MVLNIGECDVKPWGFVSDFYLFWKLNKIFLLIDKELNFLIKENSSLLVIVDIT